MQRNAILRSIFALREARVKWRVYVGTIREF